MTVELQNTKRSEDTTENLKLRIDNVGQYSQPKEIKSFLSELLKVDVKDVVCSKGPKQDYAVVKIRTDVDLKEYQQVIHGSVYGKNELRCSLFNQQPFKKQKVDEPEYECIADKVNPYWKMNYDEQLLLKKKEFQRVMNKVGRSVDTYGHNRFVSPVVPSPVLDGYRNKSEFNVGYDTNNELTVGYKMRVNGEYVTLFPDNCRVTPDFVIGIAALMQSFFRTTVHAPYDSYAHTGIWKAVTVRNTEEGKTMVIVQIHPQSLTEDEINEIKTGLINHTKDSGIDSFYLQQSTTMVVCLDYNSKMDLLYGEEYLYENLLGLKFRISPLSFFQVNTKAAELLYSQIVEECELDKDVVLLDLCSGTGTIGQVFASKVKQVIGIEVCEPAVKDAKENAKLNNITNIDFYCGKIEDLIKPVIRELYGEKIVAILDPPRSGVNASVIQAIRAVEDLKNVIYVSCSPQLANQNFVQLMCSTSKKYKGAQFTLKKALPIDLFPHTPHAELVLNFQRESNEPKNENADEPKKDTLDNMNKETSDDKENQDKEELAESKEQSLSVN